MPIAYRLSTTEDDEREGEVRVDVYGASKDQTRRGRRAPHAAHAGEAATRDERGWCRGDAARL